MIKLVFFALLRILSPKETYLNKKPFEKLVGVCIIPDIAEIVCTVPENN